MKRTVVASRTRSQTRSWALPRDPASPSQARQLTAAAITAWGSDPSVGIGDLTAALGSARPQQARRAGGASMNCRRSKAITLTLMVLTLWAAGEIGPSAESAANTAWLPAQAIPAAWAAAAAAVFALAAIAWALARLAAGSNWRPRT